MAEIQKRTETVTKNFYRMDLSQEEAEVLFVVMGSVGGDPNGPRGITQKIYDELKKSLNMDNGLDIRADRKMTGYITFADES